MTDNIRHAAIIVVGKKYILESIRFNGGQIHDIRTNPDYWKPDTVEIVIEHPDLPAVRDGDIMQRITPTYQLDYSAAVPSVRRIEPPEGQRKDKAL